MAMQVKASAVLARMQGQKLVAAHTAVKDSQETVGPAGLPPGIENGVARLYQMKLGVFENGDNKGQVFFSARGVCVLPKEHNGSPTEGAHTSIGPEPLCDTPKSLGDKARKTLADHLDWVYRHLRSFNIDTSAMEASTNAGEIAAMLEAEIEQLVERQPHFRFRTWQGKKQLTGPYKDREPKINHQWCGECDYTEEASDGIEGVMEDSTTNGVVEEVIEEPPPRAPFSKVKVAPAPTTTLSSAARVATKAPNAVKTAGTIGKALPSAIKPSAAKPAPAKGKSVPVQASEPPATFDEFGDLDSLAAEAEDEASGEKAREQLTELALAAGYDNDTILNTTSWTDVVVMIQTPISDEQGDTTDGEDTTDDSEAAVEDDTPPIPEVGQPWKYEVQVMNPRTKKTEKKMVDVEVMSINTKLSTATIKNLDTDQLIMGTDKKPLQVKFDKLV